MDPNTLTVAQLKDILIQYKQYGRKAELIARMQKVDPTEGWILEATLQTEANDDMEEAVQEDGAQPQEDEQIGQETASSLARWQTTLQARERELMQKEIELLRRENQLLRSSPTTSTTSTMSRATTSIKSIGELLSEYTGSSEDFERWKAQVKMVRSTYELDENATKILTSSKLRGKAQEWYYSLTENLTLPTDTILDKMDAMFKQPIGQLERRRQFEARQWRKDETFSSYCHDKIILGNCVPIAEDELVDYVVEGIPSETLKNQAKSSPSPRCRHY
ncbi:hypothetical protein ALC57_17652 [Trachymyrmex cornetzi]|uniref:SAP domain-containing protein n=1 Tax=Trachymyrmex cornetzi TaxID=471704 RepID=A0A151ITJ0_9HYME|nr:hypothetical protein ALC57_17652 [Trachymyrmex cornetzi]